MKIHVRRRHIVKGIAGDPRLCPIALAFKDVTGESPRVCWRVLVTNNYHFVLPRTARKFIERFDLEKPVKPFAFVLK